MASTRSGSGERESVRATALRVNPKLPAKWFEYLDAEAAPATIEYWIDLANRSPSPINGFNFEIRHYRMVEPEDSRSIIGHVAATLSTVARVRPPAAYDPFDHSPLALFLAVLQTIPAGRIRACVACDKYLVAHRENQKACSPKCANVARQKRYRERWPDYEKNRARNRVAKKQREKMKIERRTREFRNRGR